MRSKFSELVEQGVAAFQHQAIAPETSSQCPICRTYNSLWGALTDTHMSYVDGENIITGTFVGDQQKWMDLLYAGNWGGCSIRQSGFCSLANFFSSIKMCAVLTTINGQPAMKLVPEERQEPCAEIGCTCYTTSESKIPQNIARLGAVKECFEEATTLFEAAEKMNKSRAVLGNGWAVYENKIVGNVNGQNIIMEMNFDAGVKVEDDMLQELLSDEGIGELYLRQFKTFFAVDSDDKKWQKLLRKNQYNRIAAKKFDDMTPVQWLDAINDVINTIS